MLKENALYESKKRICNELATTHRAEPHFPGLKFRLEILKCELAQMELLLTRKRNKGSKRSPWGLSAQKVIKGVLRNRFPYIYGGNAGKVRLRPESAKNGF
jgi:hypothetical protein